MRKHRPAFFFSCFLLLSQLYLIGGAALAADAAVKTDTAFGYRLAGTIAAGKGYLAILALPDGGQALVRAGSVVGGVTVLAVDSDSLRLRLSKGIVDLSLAGLGRSSAVEPSAAVLGGSTDEQNRVYVREVSVDQLSRQLDASAAASRTASNPTVAGPAPDVAAQRIAAVMDLPVGSRVVAVSGEGVKSAQAAMNAIESAFAAGREGVILDIRSPNGPGRVYITRASP